MCFLGRILSRFADLWLQLRLHDLNSNGLLEIEELGCKCQVPQLIKLLAWPEPGFFLAASEAMIGNQCQIMDDVKLL